MSQNEEPKDSVILPLMLLLMALSTCGYVWFVHEKPIEELKLENKALREKVEDLTQREVDNREQIDLIKSYLPPLRGPKPGQGTAY